jgi:methylenetetrahydrofolate reductase (NADPH)
VKNTFKYITKKNNLNLMQPSNNTNSSTISSSSTTKTTTTTTTSSTTTTSPLNDFRQFAELLTQRVKAVEEYQSYLTRSLADKKLIIEQLKMTDFVPVRVVDVAIENEKNHKLWIAFEYFPPRTADGVRNLRDRMLRMKRHNPLYIDVTWGAGGTTSDTTMELCLDAQKIGLTSNMHLTCTNMPREKLDKAIIDAEKGGIRNILALRGDPPVGQVDFKPVETGFACALDLLKFLTEKSGKTFSLTCAGYPEGHPQRIKKVSEVGRELTPRERSRVSIDNTTGDEYVCTDEDYAAEIQYLKEKIAAGAGMVVTQMFFDVQVYLDFVDACRAAGIMVPIVPGIMCITSVAGFNRMSSFCKTRVPSTLAKTMKSLEKADAEEVKDFGVRFGVEMCKQILKSGKSYGLHFYTLNLDNVVDGILEGLGWTG